MYHGMGADKALEALSSSANGLSSAEAAERLKSGRNEMNDQNKNSLILMYLSQFKDLMVLMLIGAAVVNAVTAYITGSSEGLVDTFIIIFIIFLNATVGFLQQYKADKALDKLKKLSVSEAKVLRDGRAVTVDSALLVKGDVVILGEGDMVPADMRLIACDGLMTDESALTGESGRAEKSVKTVAASSPLGDRTNMCYSSTFVVKGSGRGVVSATGMDTEMGKIAKMIGGKEDLTPLQKQLNFLGKIISLSVIVIAAVIFAVSMFFSSALLDNFMSAVAIAVAAIPEGMPAVVTIIMAMGMQKMIKYGAVVRKLHVVEALGSCSVICSDKTGTLTLNRMKVVKTYAPFDEKAMLRCMSVCNTVGGKAGEYVGDPTEVALKEYAYGKGAADELPEKILPFDSDRKMMSVFCKGTTLVKGAPDVILKKCTHILDGTIRPITAADIRRINSYNETFAADALRVLGFAFREGAFCEEGLVFVGLAGMMDPPRPEVKEAVMSARRAGMKTVMITGDHKKTAFAVAKNLGIASYESEVITGEEIDCMSDREFQSRIHRLKVFARVSPHHKLRIVEAFKNRGEVVAMTGDGLNDAPAVKKADIGIAMGSGTDVTKNASDMIITDDNFATIVVAVKEGRRIFANIKKTVQFFLATNLAEVVCVFIMSVFFRSVGFLTSSQLLWINLITDSFPVVAMGVEKAEKNIMEVPPQKAGKSMFSRAALGSVLYYGIIQTAIALGCFFMANKFYGNAAASTMTFFTLSFLELIHAFNVRSEQSVMSADVFSNKVLLFTVAGAIAINVAMCYIPPVAAAFGIIPLGAAQWGVVFALSLAVLPFGEAYKAAVRRHRKKRAASPLFSAARE